MLKLTRAIAVLLVFALAAEAQYPAQDWRNVKALAAGTEVRIGAGSRTVSGQVQSVTDDSIAVTSGKGQEMFARQEVKRVSVKGKGHRVRNTLLGLGIGTGAGIGIGAGIGHAHDCSHGGFLSFCGLNTAAGGAVGGAIGLVGGTVVGAVWPTGWREVYKQ